MESRNSGHCRLLIAGACLGCMAVMLGGCGSIEVALGLRTRLDKLPVTAVSASLSPKPGLGPGQSGRLVITATTADGKQYVTVGPGHGKVLFDSFTFTATIASVNKKGAVSLPADPRVSEAVTPHVWIAVVGHPDVSAGLDIPVRYDVAFAAHFSGGAGYDGSSGFSGTDGSAGSDGTTDMNNPSGPPSAGGNGTDGTSGSDGGDGGPGEPGASVHVWVTLAPGERRLLQVRAASSQRDQLFLIDPEGGSLSVDANGGPGGRGGAGGKGGRGGSGGSGFPPGTPGLDGRDGADGHDGPGGAAGTIIESIDPAAQAFSGRIHLTNISGDGRPGPAPEIRVEPVAPLW